MAVERTSLVPIDVWPKLQLHYHLRVPCVAVEIGGVHNMEVEFLARSAFYLGFSLCILSHSLMEMQLKLIADLEREGILTHNTSSVLHSKVFTRRRRYANTGHRIMALPARICPKSLHANGTATPNIQPMCSYGRTDILLRLCYSLLFSQIT